MAHFSVDCLCFLVAYDLTPDGYSDIHASRVPYRVQDRSCDSCCSPRPSVPVRCVYFHTYTSRMPGFVRSHSATELDRRKAVVRSVQRLAEHPRDNFVSIGSRTAGWSRSRLVPIGNTGVFTLSPALFWFWVPRDDTRMMRPSDWKSRMIRVISTSFALTGFSHGAAHFSHAFSAGPFPLNPLFHLTVGELGMKGWRDERAGYKSPPSMLHGKGVYNGRQSSRRRLDARTERSSPESPL